MKDGHIKVLLIEDSPGDARLIREFLAEARGAAFDVECADRLSAGLARLAEGGIDVVLLDLGLPDSRGLDTLVQARIPAQGLPIVVLTGLDNETLGTEALRAGAQDYLVKGQVDSNLLARSVRYAIERKRAQTALGESRHFIERIADATPNIVYVYDLIENRNVYSNNQISRILGYTPEEIQGMGPNLIKRLVHPDDMEGVLEHFRKLAAAKDDEILENEYRMRNSNGQWRWLYSRDVVFARGKDGRPRQNLGTAQDITERKRAEDALRESEGRYRSLFENSPIPLREEDLSGVKDHLESLRASGVTDIASYLADHPEEVAECASKVRVTDANRATLELYGARSKEEFLECWGGPSGQESYEAFRDELVAIAGGTTIFECATVATTFAGRARNVILRWCAAPGHEQELSRVWASVVDLTDRKRAEEALRQYAERLETLREIDEAILAARSLESIAEAALRHMQTLVPCRRSSLVTFDPELRMGRVIAVRAEGETKLGKGKLVPVGQFGLAAGRGEPHISVIEDIQALPEPSEVHRTLLEEGIRSCMRTALVAEGELIGSLNLGSARPHAFGPEHREVAMEAAEVLAVAIRDAQLHEEVRRRADELEQRVVERTAELEKTNAELESFSYSVSHDLRVPLRAVAGFSHMLLEDYADRLDAEGKRKLNVILDGTRTMGQLIDGLLALSRVGRQEMALSRIDMDKLAAASFQEVKSVESDKSIRLEAGELPSARGDGSLIRQVFVNLFSNAIKFTDAKEEAVVKVGGGREGDQNVYYVRDNGAGFDMRYAHKLFGVFQRLHSKEEYAGSGVGLAIVQRIVHRHGGRVWAEGAVNGGASFYFTLPGEGGAQ